MQQSQSPPTATPPNSTADHDRDREFPPLPYRRSPECNAIVHAKIIHRIAELEAMENFDLAMRYTIAANRTLARSGYQTLPTPRAPKERRTPRKNRKRRRNDYENKETDEGNRENNQVISDHENNMNNRGKEDETENRDFNKENSDSQTVRAVLGDTPPGPSQIPVIKEQYVQHITSKKDRAAMAQKETELSHLPSELGIQSTEDIEYNLNLSDTQGSSIPPGQGNSELYSSVESSGSCITPGQSEPPYTSKNEKQKGKSRLSNIQEEEYDRDSEEFEDNSYEEQSEDDEYENDRDSESTYTNDETRSTASTTYCKNEAIASNDKQNKNKENEKKNRKRVIIDNDRILRSQSTSSLDKLT